MRIAIVSLILFLSGSSALIFQTLWLRLSGLVFGNSVWAAALILSSFMAGLALGSAIAASSKSRRLRPLHLYAGLEMAVALFGCTLVFGLPLLGEWLRPVFQILWNHQAMLNALRFSFSFLILIVPTTAMGLTLPVLLEDPLLRRHEFGRTIGLFYGSNTLGAVLGALLGENYLVRACGLLGTGLTAGFVGAAAAGIAWLLSASDRVAVGRIEECPAPLRLSAEQRLPWRLLFVSMGAGASLLCLEVVWFRFLRLYVASSPTAFSVMLAVVLFGNRDGRHRLGPDSAAHRTIKAVASNSFSAGCHRNASFLPVFPSHVSCKSHRRLLGVLAAHRATLAGFDVSRFISLRNSFSDDPHLRPSQSRKPDE